MPFAYYRRLRYIAEINNNILDDKGDVNDSGDDDNYNNNNNNHLHLHNHSINSNSWHSLNVNKIYAKRTLIALRSYYAPSIAFV